MNPARVSVVELENETRKLDRLIHKLDRRGARQTPTEHEYVLELKKRRLATKDRLHAILR